MEKINLLISEITGLIGKYEKTFVKHAKNKDDCKLNFKNTLYASLHILNKSGIDVVRSELQIENIVDSVSKNAIVKVRNNKKTFTSIQKLNNDLIELIYDSKNDFIRPYNFTLDRRGTCYIDNLNNKPDDTLFINKATCRFIACDGMQLNVNKHLINDKSVKKSKNSDYGVVCISSLFDILNGMPINYHVTESKGADIYKKKVSELAGFLDQLCHLKSGDVCVFDRLYFSLKFHKTLIENNLGYVFRMRNTSKIFKEISVGKSKIIDHNGTRVQLFKYKIEDEIYCIMTSLIDKISIKEIKALYWKRWKIETDNKKFKYDMLLHNIRSKNSNSFSVDIECLRFISILSSVIEYLGKGNLKMKQKFNTKNALYVLYRKLLYLIFYKSSDQNEISRLFGIIYNKIVAIIAGRKCARIRVSPSTKWNKNGNRYGGNGGNE